MATNKFNIPPIILIKLSLNPAPDFILDTFFKLASVELRYVRNPNFIVPNDHVQ